MDVKNYLNQIKKLSLIIEQKEQELNELRCLRGCIGSCTDYTKDRVQTSPDGASFTKLSDKTVDMERELNEYQEHYLTVRHTIVNQIQGLSKAEHIDVLYRHYIKFETFKEIECELDYSYNYVCTLHGQALKEFVDRFGDNLNFS